MGFPNQFFNDSWVVGFWRADHMGEADTILCPYRATRFRFDPRLTPLDADPPDSFFAADHNAVCSHRPEPPEDGQNDQRAAEQCRGSSARLAESKPQNGAYNSQRRENPGRRPRDRRLTNDPTRGRRHHRRLLQQNPPSPDFSHIAR